MDKIKKAIIHWLGGVTKEEMKDDGVTSFINGRRVEATIIQCAMRELYGLPAEEWCDEAWNCVRNELNDINKRYK